MKLMYGDLRKAARSEDRPLIVTTNGAVRNDGACVMGRGIARYVRDEYPDLPFRLGRLIDDHGNRPFRLTASIWTLPVKHHWAEEADLDLIAASLAHLVAMESKFGVATLLMPRPGCGNGRLAWTDVEPLMTVFDRMTVCDVEVWDFSNTEGE